MSNIGGADAPKASPSHYHKPRHQLTRSITELSSPIRLHRHNSNRRAREKDKDRDDRISISQAAPPVNARLSLDGLTRSEGVTPNLSPNPSRRTSVMISASEDNATLPSVATAAVTSKMPTPAPAPPVLREDELRRERQNAEARQSGLQKTLADVAMASNATTRRLDDAYYSVLEKVGTLQSTIGALRELAGMSHELNTTFERESADLAGDVAAQLDAFGAFEDQQARVETLQGRVRKGRVRVGALSERLNEVQRRIERWERADREWQERTRRRLKAGWVATSVVVFAMLLLFVSAQYTPGGLEGVEEKAVGFANGSLSALGNITKEAGGGKGQTPWDLADTQDNAAVNRDLNRTAGEAHTPPEAAEQMLRVFDEL